MSFCPKCNAELAANATRCEECGYDFPLTPEPTERQGFVYSGVAEAALVIGDIVAIFLMVAVVLGGVSALLSGELWEALAMAPLRFFLLVAIVVVIERVRRQ